MMVLCNKECEPCCDFCIYAIQEKYIDDDGRTIYGAPEGCSLHLDREHQDIAENFSFCDDFHCFLAKQKAPVKTDA